MLTQPARASAGSRPAHEDRRSRNDHRDRRANRDRDDAPLRVGEPAEECERGRSQSRYEIRESHEAAALDGFREGDELRRGGDVGHAPAQSEQEEGERHPGNLDHPREHHGRDRHDHETSDERTVPTDAVDELADDEDEPEHPDDVKADDGEDVGLLVVVADHDVAGEVHDAGHHGEARDCRQHGRGHSGPPQDLPERRGYLLGGRDARRKPGMFELERDSPRVRANRERDDQPDDAHRGRGEPRDDERVQLEVLPGEERPEDQRPRGSTEERTEEDVRDRARLARLRVHVGDRCPGKQHGAVHRADAREPEDDERRRVEDATEGRQDAAAEADDETPGDDGYATVPIHQTAGRKRRERSGGQEDRGPETEDRLDPGHEHERDRPHGDRELQDARKRDETEGEKDRVALDLSRSRHSARLALRPRCGRRYDGPSVTGSSGQPG